MLVQVRIAVLAVLSVGLGAVPALAADYCVGVTRDNCTAKPTLDAVLADQARADGDRIFVGEGTQTPSDANIGFADAGKAIKLWGAGPKTVLKGALRLSGKGSLVHSVRLEPRAADAALTATADARLMYAVLAIGGRGLVADGASLVADDIDIVLAPGAQAALTARCEPGLDGALLARHVTVTGATAVPRGAANCRLAAQTATLSLRSSIVAGSDPFAAQPTDGTGTGRITTAFSAHADDPDASADHRIDGDPQLDDERRPHAGSPVVDAGDPAPLAVGDEPLLDLAGLTRVTDSNGDGEVRRDAGAYELQPPPAAPVSGNVLVNPGAEDGLTGWTGAFDASPFSGDFFPPPAVAGALGAGGALFSGSADAMQPELSQRIDVAASAPAIDTGGGTASLSGLLGGYAADQDEVALVASFRDPEGTMIGTLTVPGPTAAERGNDTNLLQRKAAGAIPPRTRVIDVKIAGRRVGGGGYTDSYADNTALVLSVPGVSVETPPDPGGPVVQGLKPFAGVTVLTPHMTFSTHGRSHVTLACASATVGACTGTLELRARLPRAKAPSRIARYVKFSVQPGRRQVQTVRLLVAARKALARRTKIAALLLSIAHDGQGVQRSRTVPLKLKLPAARR